MTVPNDKETDIQSSLDVSESVLAHQFKQIASATALMEHLEKSMDSIEKKIDRMLEADVYTDMGSLAELETLEKSWSELQQHITTLDIAGSETDEEVAEKLLKESGLTEVLSTLDKFRGKEAEIERSEKSEKSEKNEKNERESSESPRQSKSDDKQPERSGRSSGR